jgi:hypothetical protein
MDHAHYSDNDAQSSGREQELYSHTATLAPWYTPSAGRCSPDELYGIFMLRSSGYALRADGNLVPQTYHAAQSLFQLIQRYTVPNG